MGEWGGGRCDDGAGGAGFGHDRTTPWGISTVADTMTGSVAPLHGGQTTKNASGQAAGGEGADLHRVLCRPTQPGGPAWAGDGSPACRRGGCARLGPASSPWHSELRQAAPRALSRVALLVGGRAGTHQDSQSRSLAGSRRRAGRGGAQRGPGGAERRQAALRHSARGPVSPRARQAAPLRRSGQLACPTSRCCCSNLRAKWAAGTAHMPQRPGTTGTQRQHATWAAALLGRLPRLPSLGRGRSRLVAIAPLRARAIEVVSAG